MHTQSNIGNHQMNSRNIKHRHCRLIKRNAMQIRNCISTCSGNRKRCNASDASRPLVGSYKIIMHAVVQWSPAAKRLHHHDRLHPQFRGHHCRSWWCATPNGGKYKFAVGYVLRLGYRAGCCAKHPREL